MRDHGAITPAGGRAQTENLSSALTRRWAGPAARPIGPRPSPQREADHGPAAVLSTTEPTAASFSAQSSRRCPVGRAHWARSSSPRRRAASRRRLPSSPASPSPAALTGLIRPHGATATAPSEHPRPAACLGPLACCGRGARVPVCDGARRAKAGPVRPRPGAALHHSPRPSRASWADGGVLIGRLFLGPTHGPRPRCRLGLSRAAPTR